jgi:hypothetical protein
VGWDLSLTENLINEQLLIPMKHSHLGVMSTTSALCNTNTEMSDMINVSFSDQ